jgi:hypothetical protein
MPLLHSSFVRLVVATIRFSLAISIARQGAPPPIAGQDARTLSLVGCSMTSLFVFSHGGIGAISLFHALALALLVPGVVPAPCVSPQCLDVVLPTLSRVGTSAWSTEAVQAVLATSVAVELTGWLLGLAAVADLG